VTVLLYTLVVYSENEIKPCQVVSSNVRQTHFGNPFCCCMLNMLRFALPPELIKSLAFAGSDWQSCNMPPTVRGIEKKAMKLLKDC